MGNTQTSNRKGVPLDIPISDTNDNPINKVLLFGTGDCGKSTFYKFLKVFNEVDDKWTTELITSYNDVLQLNLIHDIVNIVSAAVKLEDKGDNTGVHNPSVREAVAFFNKDVYDIERNLDQISRHLQNLLNHNVIQNTLAFRSQFQVGTNVQYLIDNYERIADKEYMCTFDDVLRSRIKTTGIIEYSITFHDHCYSIVDTGGQRSERKKWPHTYTNFCDGQNILEKNIVGVVFFVATTEYDQTLYEDNCSNRMQESYELFKNQCAITPSPFPKIILVFNKIDILKEKILTTDLSVCFPEYTGGKNYQNACLFLEKKFREATTRQIEVIFTSVINADDSLQLLELMDKTFTSTSPTTENV